LQSTEHDFCASSLGHPVNRAPKTNLLQQPSSSFRHFYLCTPSGSSSFFSSTLFLERTKRNRRAHFLLPPSSGEFSNISAAERASWRARASLSLHFFSGGFVSIPHSRTHTHTARRETKACPSFFSCSTNFLPLQAHTRKDRERTARAVQDEKHIQRPVCSRPAAFIRLNEAARHTEYPTLFYTQTHTPKAGALMCWLSLFSLLHFGLSFYPFPFS